MVGWHAPVGKTAPVDATGRPMLVLRAINRNEKVELTAAYAPVPVEDFVAR